MLVYVVRAYDTDFGSDCSWQFSNEKAAEDFAKALRYDYGNECQATVTKSLI